MQLLNLYQSEVQLCFISHLTKLERISSNASRHNKLGSQEPSVGDSLRPDYNSGLIQLAVKDDIMCCLTRDTLCVK